MGLLERALQYKQKLNDTGKETLIDRITGPAETEPANTHKIKRVDVAELETDEIYEPFNDHDAVDKISHAVIDDKKKSGEDIILFNEDEYPDKESEIIENSSTKFPDNDNEIDLLNDEIIESSDPQESMITDQNVLPESDPEINHTEFNDFSALYEIQKEFLRADTAEEVYATIIFSIMGQIGVSSVSIISPLKDDPDKWGIMDSSGIKLSDDKVFWDGNSGIINILNIFKGLLDIEDLKNDNDLRDDYYKFTSIDARFIIPLLRDNNLAGAVLVGEKINSEEFTESELNFLNELSETGSMILKSLTKYEKSSTELMAHRIEKEIFSDVELFQESLLNVTSIDELIDVIRKNFFSLGLESYTIFINDRSGNDFIPAYFESDDIMGFFDSGFKIKGDNRLVTFLVNNKSSIILENFSESNVIIDTFGRTRVSKMDYFIAYPFIISGKLSGFMTFFRINPAVDIIDIDIRAQKINRFIFPYIYRIFDLDPEQNRYNDLTASFYDRVDRELKHAAEMNIPLSLILISIKNYKRFHDRFGKIELDKLLSTSGKIIKSKLGEGDFASRIDRSKFLLVLPGKDKRYSIIIANSIKNEIVDNYNMTDFKLLVSTLQSVFPDDGKDLFSILEVLE